MEVGKLTVTLRETSGKGGSRKLRAQGKVPGVCYGSSVDGRIEPLPNTVDVKSLRGALDPVRKRNTVISLTIEGGGAPRSLHALVKDFQIDALRRDITHVDLLAIDPNKEVRAEVPLEFNGKPKGAVDGGQLRIVLRTLSVRAKPAAPRAARAGRDAKPARAARDAKAAPAGKPAPAAAAKPAAKK